MAKKIVFGFLLLITAFLLGGGLVSFFYADKVKAIVVEVVNKNLNTRAQVKKIEFTLFSTFPNASVVFEDVFVEEKKRQYPDTLFFAKKISFFLGLGQLFQDHFTIKKLLVDQGVLKLSTDKKGQHNYEIWKNDSLPQNQKHGLFKLEEVLFENTRILYVNDYKETGFSTLVKRGTFKGEFSSQLFDLEANAEMDVTYFKAGSVNYIHQKETKLSFVFQIDIAAKKYTIKSSTLRLANLNLLVDGTVTQTFPGFLLDLHVSSPGSGPQELLSLLPLKDKNSITKFSYKGAVLFDMYIRGILDKKNSPLIELSFGAKNVSIIPKKGGEALRQINFTAIYTNRKKTASNASFLAINKFTAQLQKQLVQGNLEITNFENPFVKFNFNGTIDLELLGPFILPDTIRNFSGMLTSNISFSGKKDVLNSYKATGSINVKKLNFLIKDNPIPFLDLNGTFSLKDTETKMERFTGKIGESDFELNGVFSNLFFCLLLPDQKLGIKASLFSHKLNLSELLFKNESTNKKDSGHSIQFPGWLTAELNVNLENLHFQKFESSGLTGTLSLNNKVLSTNGIKINSMSGTTLLKGMINTLRNDSILISAEANINKIDITQLFYQMGNFGQAVIGDKNLKGVVSAEIQFASIWSADLICNTNKVYSNATLIVENGELINFEPTQALSKYIKGADFKNIKFSTLKNKVEIKNRTIHFSSMEIKSSAMDITTSGTHSFDNIVDYKIKILLSQLLGKKVKEQNTEFGTIEDDGLGRTSIFLRMYGPMKDPKFDYDSKSVEEKIVTDIKNEKQNLKSVLNKEFGWFKNDTIPVKKTDNSVKKEEIQIDYEEETEEK